MLLKSSNGVRSTTSQWSAKHDIPISLPVYAYLIYINYPVLSNFKCWDSTADSLVGCKRKVGRILWKIEQN